MLGRLQGVRVSCKQPVVQPCRTLQRTVAERRLIQKQRFNKRLQVQQHLQTGVQEARVPDILEPPSLHRVLSFAGVSV